MMHRMLSICFWTLGIALLLIKPATAQPHFADVTAEAIAEELFTSRSIAVGDYDNDGWPDIFLRENEGPRFRLLHNQGDGRLVNQASRLRNGVPSDQSAFFDHGGGALFGDYDNDGDLDLFVPLRGHNRLLRNDQGLFTRVGQEAGLTDSAKTDNATWLDYDRDGHLDLYIGNNNSAPVSNILYRNSGDGTFADVTGAAGLEIDLFPNDCCNGGMVAGDFNDDGWPDLYMGNILGPNRLLLNNGQGRFEDATTGEIADPGEAFGVAAGDIDNDGDLDIYQATGGGHEAFRSLMLLNLGDAEFLDVSEGVGLVALGALNSVLPALADLDNDGDLDLFVNQIIGNAAIPFLFLNNGNGRFIDGTEPSGIRHGGYLALADYNRDGFLDMFATDGPAKDKTLYRNDGNDNHWLIVEPIGVASNRQGIGARLTATADKLQQMREVFGGGNGFNQSESQVHFGLGVQLQVDQLEIRWPSGQVDLLEDIAADQYIRVIEGRGAYFTVQPTVWDVVPPDMLFVDGPALLNAAVRPARFEPEAQIVRVSADLRGLGGEQNVPLNETAAGLYALQDVLLELGPAVGLWTLDILIEQETSLGPYWSRLTRELTIVPAADQVIFGAPEKTQWSDSNEIEAETFAGHRALRLQNRQAPFYKPEAPVPIAGYTAFRFLFYPGEIEAATTNRIQVSINGKRTNIFPLSDFAMTLDLEQAQWQEVIVPLDSFGLNPGDAIESIFFTINLKGEAHLAEIRLLRQQPSLNTAVVEDQTDTEPQSFDLEQNYPNPFNSGTVIRFALPVSEQIELALYNLAGQKVQTLVQGQRPAGAYTVRWDGRDADGRALASGMYFYRLSANGKSTIRKLLLLR